jgi:hypothetical protein
LIRKDKHAVDLLLKLFGRKVSELISDKLVKSVILPELYFSWRAKFLKRAQDYLSEPKAIAVNEEGTIVIIDGNTVVSVKLSNPVAPTRLVSSNPSSRSGAARQGPRNLSSVELRDACGCTFLAREVALVSDRSDNKLHILHVNDDAAFEVNISSTLGDFQIEEPFGVAAVVRLDATEPGPKVLPRAIVAVTECNRSTLLLLVIEQNKGSLTKPYTVTRACRIQVAGQAKATMRRMLRGVAALPIRRINISVLRARRDEAISVAEQAMSDDESANGDVDDAIAAARRQFEADSRTSSKVAFSRLGCGANTESRSDIVEIDVARVLDMLNETATSVNKRMRGEETVSLNGALLAHLAEGENAGAVAIDANEVVYAAETHRVIKCGGAGANATATFIEGEPHAGSVAPGATWWGSQPKDGIAAESTFGSIAALAAWPCGTTLFGLDAGEGVAAGLFKIASLRGLAKWFDAWRGQIESFGEKDPTMKGDPAYCAKEPPTWTEALTELERTARILDGIMQSRLDALGREHVNGPHAMMDTNSLR